MAAVVVRLNVGGVEHCVSSTTICARKSRLSQIVADRNAVRDAEGRIFVDRNGALFRFVLDFLRDGEINPPSGFVEWGALQREFAFFFGSDFEGFDYPTAAPPAAPAPAPA
eukprot:Hpha_TRINITY_DN8937_c0_g2::TRINITY_DN8937_c0_g2_i1::g.80723::m.80723